MSLRVCAAGLVTPVGGTFETTCSAMRAGIRNVTKANIFDRASGAYIDAGQVPLHQWWEGPDVIPDLVAPAILECLDSAHPSRPEQIPIVLGLPGPDRPGRPPGFDATVLTAVAERLNFRLHPSSGVIFAGQVSICKAILEVRRVAKENNKRAFIVAAVDSLVRTATVRAYIERSRILTPINSNGFSPGEAGAAVLLSTSDHAPGLEILGVGLANETATIDSEDPLRGEGLTEAVRAALNDAGMGMENVSYRITDLNGEHYKFKEAVFAFVRLLTQSATADIALWHPNEYIGDVGAAIGPLALALGLHAAQNGYAPGDVVLFHFGSDDGERGAVVARFVGLH
jgi:3-oxoacyl-[acyl-carrier-protein] synthase I